MSSASGLDPISGVTSLIGAHKQMQTSEDLLNMSKSAFAQENPFGPYRAEYAQQLSTLMADPSSFLKNPEFQAALQQGESGVVKQMAAQGFTGSGNEATALMDYGTSQSWSAMQEQIQTLAGLAGANIQPNFGASLGGVAASAGIQDNALASFGYGVNQIGPDTHPMSTISNLFGSSGSGGGGGGGGGGMGGMMGAMGGMMGGSGTGGGMGFLSSLFAMGAAGSDRRIKYNIRQIGFTPFMNLPLYTFRYLFNGVESEGVMADEVEQVLPSAVTLDPLGFKRVNYAMVG